MRQTKKSQIPIEHLKKDVSVYFKKTGKLVLNEKVEKYCILQLISVLLRTINVENFNYVQYYSSKIMKKITILTVFNLEI